jgi:hypothetical protein
LLHCNGRLTTRYVSTETWSEAKTWLDQQLVITMWSHGAFGCSFVCFRIPNRPTWQLFTVVTKATDTSGHSTCFPPQTFVQQFPFTEAKSCPHWVCCVSFAGTESLEGASVQKWRQRYFHSKQGGWSHGLVTQLHFIETNMFISRVLL